MDARAQRAIIYARTSGDAAGSTSIAGQVEECQSHCDRNGWRVVKIIKEVGSGSERGRRLERPGLLEARQLYGQFDRLVCWRLDRLARSVVDLKQLITETQGNNVSMVSVTEGYDFATPTGRGIATIISVIAEMEAELIRERTLAGKRRASVQGRYLGGPVPRGFRTVPAEGGGKILEVDPVLSEIVKSAASMLVAGESWLGVARWLNTTELRPARSEGWSPHRIRAMFESEHVQRLLTATERRQLRALREGARRPYAGGRPKRLLSSLMYCGTCGTVMNLRPGKGQQIYRCAAVVYGTPCSGPVSIGADRADAGFTEEFLDGWGRHQKPVPFTVADATRSKINELDGEMEDLRRRLLGAEPDEVVEIGERMRAVRLELEELEAKDTDDDMVVFGRDDTTTQEHWDAADTAGRRDLIRFWLPHGLIVGAVGPGKRVPAVDRMWVRLEDGSRGAPFREAAADV